MKKITFLSSGQKLVNRDAEEEFLDCFYGTSAYFNVVFLMCCNNYLCQQLIANEQLIDYGFCMVTLQRNDSNKHSVTELKP